MRCSPIIGLLGGLTAVAAAPVAAPAQETFARARALYAENRVAEALPLFEEAAREEPGNATVLAWLAETARRAGDFVEAHDAARAALALDGCHAFALGVLGFLYQPIYSRWDGASADSTWHYYRRAVACDPEDGNAWLGLWMEALRRDEAEWETGALRAIGSNGFLPRTVLAFNRWVLQALPPDAVLLTGGDWDTFPALAAQLVDHVRPDVGVVNLPMLNLAWYARLVTARYGLTPALPDAELERLHLSGLLADSVVRIWRARSAAGVLGRPLAVASTAVLPGEGAGAVVEAGPYGLVVPDTAPPDTAAMRRALADARGADFAGPEVSPADRSSIRIQAAAQRPMATNVLRIALQYALLLAELGAVEEADRALAWADAFVAEAGLGTLREDMLRSARDAVAGVRDR